MANQQQFQQTEGENQSQGFKFEIRSVEGEQMSEHEHHVMIDIETMGLKPGHRITSVAAIEFDPWGDMSSVRDILNYRVRPYTTSKVDDNNTIEWRLSHSVDEEEQKLTQLSMNQIHYIWQDTMNASSYVWSKGPSFDMAFLDDLKLYHPWTYKREMCVRTIMYLAELFNDDIMPWLADWEKDLILSLPLHSARGDCYRQIAHVQRAFQILYAE